jgi:hypothetical protein
MSVLRYQGQSRKRKKKVKEGMKFVLNHFAKGNVFPREIASQQSSSSFAEPAVTIVNNKNEMLRVYEQSGFIDCKISPSPAFDTEKFIHNNRINIQTPDFIFINMASKSPSSLPSSPPTILSCNSGGRIVDQVNGLFPILQNIKELLYGANTTILWTGNGFQIYQPVQRATLEDIEEEYIDFEHLEEFRKFVTQQYLLSNLFLEFSKQRLLSYNKGNRIHSLDDPLWKSSPTHSFPNPSMLMIPGKLNSKCIVNSSTEQEIEIVQTWDGNRPKVDLLLANFRAYLTDQKEYQEKKGGVGGRKEKTTACYHFQ